MHNAIYDNQLTKLTMAVQIYFLCTRMPIILDVHLSVTGIEHVFITGESMVEKVNQNVPQNN